MLTIGEFSRLGRVSARMLRHYDGLGLLCPEQIGENGYRYYKQEQLGSLNGILVIHNIKITQADTGLAFCAENARPLPVPLLRP